MNAAEDTITDGSMFSIIYGLGWTDMVYIATNIDIIFWADFDNDDDVDGLDLAEYAAGSDFSDLPDFANNFGRAD